MFGAVIFTAAHNSDIGSLAELKGKSFAAVGKAAFGGFQMAWRELKEAGIDPFTDLELRFMGFATDAWTPVPYVPIFWNAWPTAGTLSWLILRC